MKADYRSMADKLMDLRHETHVHADSIGQKEIDEAAPKTTAEGDKVVTWRFMENPVVPPFWQTALRSNGLPDDQLVDRWQIGRFSPPSHVMIEKGVALAGKGGHDADPSFKVASADDGSFELRLASSGRVIAVARVLPTSVANIWLLLLVPEALPQQAPLVTRLAWADAHQNRAAATTPRAKDSGCSAVSACFD